MRVLFLLLLLANLAFFAWARFFAPPHPSTDPRPPAQQIEPDKLAILTPAQVASAQAPKGKPIAEAAPAACVEWGGFSVADARRAEQALEPLALGARLGQRRAEETAGWWVYIAAQPNRQAAQKKAAELKGLGVDEWFIVQDEGRWRWAISLGVFRSEAAARSRLETLTAKGVRSALVGERETQLEKIWLQLRNVDAALAARLKELSAGFEGSELRDCQ